MKHQYLDSPNSFKIFAHRGLKYIAGTEQLDENSIAAFANALDQGANYLELDVQASADGKAVVFHDATLDRVSNASGRVKNFTWLKLQNVSLKKGGVISSFQQVLELFPDAKINIDVKEVSAIEDLAATIKANRAEGRVLLTSFSEKRRNLALAAAPGVATSPSASLVLKIKIAQLLNFRLQQLLKNLNVLQIPVSYGLLRLDSPKFIESVKRCGVEVIYWTINDPAEAVRLRNIGANGIVTDRTDLMISALQ